MGANYLNKLLEEFVDEVHDDDRKNNLTVGIFNDHSVEGCFSTEDGVHHKSIIPIRLRLLSNTIESYSKCSVNLS